MKTEVGGLWFVLFAVLLLVLKLLGKIAISWWWVTAPLWAPVALCFSIVGFIGSAALIGAVIFRNYK